MNRLVVFDCDGTLVDGQAAICNTMEQAFATAGLPTPERNAVRRMVGLSLPYALRELAPDASDDERARVVDAYKDGYRNLRTTGALREPLWCVERIAAEFELPLVERAPVVERVRAVGIDEEPRVLHFGDDVYKR